MYDYLIQSVVEEVRAKSVNHFLGKIFQLAPLSLALDLGVKGSFLFIGAEPSSPRFYLIRRKVKDLEKASTPLSYFGQLVRAQLGGGQLVNIDKDPGERVVRLTFRVQDGLGEVHFRRLVAQLTGRAANLFLLDELNRVKATLRFPKGPGQGPNEYYLVPSGQRTQTSAGRIEIAISPSESADLYFQKLDAQKLFDSRVATLRGQLRKKIEQRTKLLANLEKDLEMHGDPDRHKKLGDLLLANLSNAVRNGNKTTVTDFYSEGAPLIEIEIDPATTLQDAASQFFRQYTRAKRARREITERIDTLRCEIKSLHDQQQHLQAIAENYDEEALMELAPQAVRSQSPRKTQEERIPGLRRYLSSDGYEILVGRGAKDNDNLTFHIARPNDLWLHAGDYPGSHVVVRNPRRKEIPHRTIIEAAQLAGRFSQASEDAKVVIHYTERKFLAKPKGAAPGLVRLSKFKSMTVQPKEAVARVL